MEKLLDLAATLGDVVIALVAFWAVALGCRSRRWMLQPTGRQVAGFVALGVAITIVLEWLATQMLGRWAYADSMPVVPVLDVAFSPLLQWFILPPLVIWFVHRQLT